MPEDRMCGVPTYLIATSGNVVFNAARHSLTGRTFLKMMALYVISPLNIPLQTTHIKVVSFFGR